MVRTNSTAAAVSVTQDGKAQTAPCPLVLMSAMTMEDVWTGSACVIRATQGTTAASWCVQTTATTRGTAWMGNVCASHTSPARPAASRGAQMTAVIMAVVWTACASVMMVLPGKTAHLVSLKLWHIKIWHTHSWGGSWNTRKTGTNPYGPVKISNRPNHSDFVEPYSFQLHALMSDVSSSLSNILQQSQNQAWLSKYLSFLSCLCPCRSCEIHTLISHITKTSDMWKSGQVTKSSPLWPQSPPDPNRAVLHPPCLRNDNQWNAAGMRGLALSETVFEWVLCFKQHPPEHQDVVSHIVLEPRWVALTSSVCGLNDVADRWTLFIL